MEPMLLNRKVHENRNKLFIFHFLPSFGNIEKNLPLQLYIYYFQHLTILNQYWNIKFLIIDHFQSLITFT